MREAGLWIGKPLADTYVKELVMKNDFRAWVVARHKSSQEIKLLDYIDWKTDYKWGVTYNQNANPRVSVATLEGKDKITVEHNAAGGQSLIIGGPVPPQVLIFEKP